MVDVGTAALQIIPSFKGFEGKLGSGMDGPLSSSGARGGKVFGDSAGKSMTASFKSHAKLAAVAAGAGLATAGYALFKFGQDSIAEARESQKVGALTEQVIKSTGGAAKVTAKQVGDLSTAISLKSGIDDEAIQSGENMLLTFKNVRNEVGKGNDIFSQATQLTTDMAAAMAGGKGGDIDLKSSAIQVGKALGDPVKGVTALAKVGVTFSNQQRAQIKALVEGGDANAAMALGLIDTSTTYNNLLKENGGNAKAVADILTKDLTPAQKKAFDLYSEGGHTLEAQKRILTELKSEFGGAAAAQATMGEKVATAWGNIKEQFGTAILPLVDDVEKAFLKKGVPAIQGFADMFQKKGIPAIHDFIDDAKPLANSILPAIGDALHVAKDAAGKIAPVLKGTFDAFNKLPDSVKTLLILSAGGAAVAKKVGAFSLGKSVLGAVTKSSPMPVFVVNQVPGLPGTPKTPTVVGEGSKIGSILKYAGPPAIAAAVGHEIASHFPKEMPFGTQGFLPGAPHKSGDTGLLQGDLSVLKNFGPALTAFSAGGKVGGKVADLLPFGGGDAPKVDTHALDAANAQVRGLMANVESLPDALITKIALDGAPESKKEAADLAKQYDLTPKEKRTLFQTYGIPEGKKYVGSLQDLMGKTPKEKRTQFGVDGIPKAKNDLLGLSHQLAATAVPRRGAVTVDTSAAEANLNRVLALMARVNRAGNVPSAPGVLPGESAPRTAAPRSAAPQRTHVNLHVDGRQFDAYVDERIATHGDMADEHRRAKR